jgi:hypothetical protein
MSYPVKNGQTSVVLRFKLLDSSSSVGAGLTGLTSASSGLIISTIADNEASATAYTVAGSTIESITTLGTFATPTATKCRFKEVDSTNHKGIYEFQFADARFAVSGAKSLLVSVLGATNLVQADFVVPLVVDDPYTAKLTDKTGYSLSQSFPTNFASMSIDASGRLDIIKINGTSQTARDIGASVLLSSGTGTGQLSLSSGTVTVGTNNDKTGYSLSQSFPSNFSSLGISAGGHITTVDTVTTVTNQLTAAQIATGVWQDTTAGDFTVSASIGKSVMNGVALGTGLTVNDITTKTGFALTSAYDPAKTASQAGDAMALTSGATQAIWDKLTSALTTVGSIGKLLVDNINATISSRLASSSYTAPLDAAGTRSALGLASANVDTQLSGIDTDVLAVKAKTDLIPGTQDGLTFAQYVKLSGAVLLGKASGLDTTTAVFRAADDSKDRVTATVDANGNRSAVTLDAS